jgi:hypothetical protein
MEEWPTRQGKKNMRRPVGLGGAPGAAEGKKKFGWAGWVAPPPPIRTCTFLMSEARRKRIDSDHFGHQNG